ncbi:helix-turn-helix transcriptional regulator [Helcococcus kunzii]|uniref:helix-turn-helix domain-containing protein n=1 Tax=Helcococcus kunzii TaxID=40091 RepID=UPI001BB0B6B6|nr:helix-turn-helix transcriptional regulator [Helcococcus kunzii]QUY64268.1 helix-turn-helix transcriptional regulator [Helcococcus kunzii]
MSIEQNVDKLYKMRIYSNLSQNSIAKKINISESRYQNYEKGRRNLPISLSRKIAKIFKVNWWELYEE